MRSTLIGLALLAPLMTAASAERDRDAVPPATPAGEPVSCIPVRSIQQSLVRSDRVIDFIMLGNKVYRNTLPNDCPNLGFEQRFAYATSLNVLCSADIITVLYVTPLMRGASCGLGPFQPVTLPPRPKRP